ETCNPVDLSGGGSDITCWRAPGMLDGLLMDDGTTPTDAWFVHQAYAQMTGAGFTLLDSTIADPEASVVSTVGANGAIHVLLGRHTGCQVGIDDMCPGASYAAPKQVAAVLSVARNSRARYNVTVQRIASVHGASSGPVTIATTTVAAANGRVNAGTYTVADGAALDVVVHGGGAVDRLSQGVRERVRVTDGDEPGVAAGDLTEHREVGHDGGHALRERLHDGEPESLLDAGRGNGGSVVVPAGELGVRHVAGAVQARR